MTVRTQRIEKLRRIVEAAHEALLIEDLGRARVELLAAAQEVEILVHHYPRPPSP